MNRPLASVLNASQAATRRLCVNGTPWIWQLLEQCVENTWDYCSIVVGLFSIACFLCAALPQLYVAYKNENVHQALSLGFLLCWLCGDVTNFIGCYLTNQLPIQTVTAIFYIDMDIIVISQFAYYRLKHQKIKRSSSLKTACFAWVAVFITLSITLPGHLFLEEEHSAELNSDLESLGIGEMSGFICGYISSVFYLGSRFPQLYKNFQRKSTEGTSYMLFALAMMGNCTYGLSLVLKLPAIRHYKSLYVIHHLPWLIGSFGVLLLDFCITAQFILYRKPKNEESDTMSFEEEPLLVDDSSH
ncbi:lysosomal amino acid transporter 1 homolog [Ambystoma mexicanum]|uniref:lysosomal amino acid transporter 1 homolog n=1 Tax=Ambystoma mexicanum TaxID=8296 RepID=UPI0037E93639